MILRDVGDSREAMYETTVLYIPHFYAMIVLSQSRSTLELQKIDLLNKPKDDNWKEEQFSNLRWKTSKGHWDLCSEGQGWIRSVEASGYGRDSEAHLMEELQFTTPIQNLLKCLVLK